MKGSTLDTAFFLACLALFGLLFGSFANVVIWRLPRGESLVTPPSACPTCHTQIAWYDNIPVLSWLILGGRCRSCKTRISARYPIVEAISGLLWVLAGVTWGMSVQTAFGVALFYLLMILAFIDWDTMRLPNPLVGLVAGIGAIGVVVAQFLGVPAVPLLSGAGLLASPLAFAVAGVALGGGVTLAIAAAYAAIRKTEGFGMGDVKLLGALGIYLGPYILMCFFIASLIGAVYAIVAAKAKGGSLRAKVPFGPFIALAGIVTALTGSAIWHGYLRIVTGG